jgi:hypothetical protein
MEQAVAAPRNPENATISAPLLTIPQLTTLATSNVSELINTRRGPNRSVRRPPNNRRLAYRIRYAGPIHSPVATPSSDAISRRTVITPGTA